MPSPKPTNVVDMHHQMQLNDLHKEISLIKDNHLAHIQSSISKLEDDVKDTKDNFDKRFDKLDERIWVVVGLTVTTLISIVVSGIM